MGESKFVGCKIIFKGVFEYLNLVLKIIMRKSFEIIKKKDTYIYIYIQKFDQENLLLSVYCSLLTVENVGKGLKSLTLR